MTHEYKLYISRKVLRDMLDSKKAVAYYYTLDDGLRVKLGEAEQMHKLDELERLRKEEVKP